MKILKYWLCFVLICLSFVGGGSSAAYASTSDYTSVIDDLTSDSSFKASDYPSNENDYSLNVIQIAESSDGELFVYVYQPSGKMTATSINISTAINDSLKYVNYKLTYLNSSGVFYKYRVEGLTVKSDTVRYYDISSVFRKWVEGIDNEASGGNTVDEVSYAVSQLWTACTINGEVSYNMLSTETIVVTDKYVGFIRYIDGFSLYKDSCDSHYVAFSTDKPIDRLMEADVYYVSRDFTEYMSLFGTNYTYGDEEKHYVSLDYTQKAENDVGGLIPGNKYTWDRIQSVSDFIATEELTEESKEYLSGKEWVLRFCETDYYQGAVIGGTRQSTGTQVTQVTILRLKFETDGITYNLGVVDNKQTGDLNPDNYPDPEFNIPWYVWALLGLVAVILLVVLINPVASLLLFILKGIWAIVSAPFKFIGWIVQKIRERRE